MARFRGPVAGGSWRSIGTSVNLFGDVTGTDAANTVATVGGASAANIANGVAAMQNAVYSSFSAGTAAALPATASIAQLTFGTTSPSMTIVVAGSYMIRALVSLQFAGATFAGSQLVTLKLRRTNNTAGDLTNGTQTTITGIVTTLTASLGQVMIEVPAYVATAGDIIQLWGGVATAPSVGALNAVAAQIIGQRYW